MGAPDHTVQLDAVSCQSGRLLCDTARRFLRKQGDMLARHLDSAKTRNDIEDVHQVRVACRRMRAGLAFFGDCFDDDKADRWRGQLKKALRRFGPARDCDVQIAFLKDVLSRLDSEQKPYKPGLARLLLRLNQQRDALQPKIIKAVQRLARERLLLNIHLETERLQYEADHAEQKFCGADFYQRAAERVGRCLQQVQDKLGSLADAEAVAEHHALRIAVKKLRYTLEVCDTGLRGQLKTLIKQLKQLQTLLGDMHDCDVWQTQIETFICQEKARTEAYFGHSRPMSRLMPGLRYLQTQRQQERARLFEAAVQMAEAMSAEGFWDAVASSIRPEALPPDTLTPSTESDADDNADNGH